MLKFGCQTKILLFLTPILWAPKPTPFLRCACFISLFCLFLFMPSSRFPSSSVAPSSAAYSVDGRPVSCVFDANMPFSSCPVTWTGDSPSHVYPNGFTFATLLPLCPSGSSSCFILGLDWMNAEQFVCNSVSWLSFASLFQLIINRVVTIHSSHPSGRVHLVRCPP